MAEEQAILAGGCFWCTEAVFKDLIGVSTVESGYIGGHADNPTYRQVCAGDTGHAEAIRVTYDPDQILEHRLGAPEASASQNRLFLCHLSSPSNPPDQR